jgi:hypothetical protein
MQRDSLRVGSKRNPPINEYRVNGRAVQFRALGRDQKPSPAWRELTNDEILLHLSLHTSVAQWLVKRLGVHPQMLRLFSGKES